MDNDLERLNRLERWRAFHANAGSDPHRTYAVTLWPTAQKLWAFLRNARVELVEAGAVVLHPNGDVLIDPPVFGQTIERRMQGATMQSKPSKRTPKAPAVAASRAGSRRKGAPVREAPPA